MKVSDYSATSSWSGIQNKPAAVAGIEEANPPQITVTITLAALTVGGNTGSITIVNGVVTAVEKPT
jgi:hypothetical protein